MALKRLTETRPSRKFEMSSKAWGSCRSQGVNPGGTASSADLGDSSKYSDELLRAEVGKGSMRTAFDHGLVDPKAKGNSNKSDLVTWAERESG